MGTWGPGNLRFDRMLATIGDPVSGPTMTRICLAALLVIACGSRRPGPAAGDSPPERCCCRQVDGDDQAVAPRSASGPHKVLVVTEDNLYLEGAMLTLDDIEVRKLTPAAYAADPERAYADVHVGVFDDYTPNEVPPLHAIYFHPDQAGSPIPVSGTVEGSPRITDLAEDHPVMRWVTLSDVGFGASRVFAPRRDHGEVALATSAHGVVIAARYDRGRKIVAVGFSLGDSDLVLRTAFPLLLINTFDWFASDAEQERFEPRSVDACEGDAGGVCVAMEHCQSPSDGPR
jgi:hypothetical protein